MAFPCWYISAHTFDIQPLALSPPMVSQEHQAAFRVPHGCPCGLMSMGPAGLADSIT